MIPETPGYTRARRLLSLSSVVRDALPVMRAAVANTAVLRIAMDAHAPLVEVNPVAMHRVLMKLVQNASQAIRQPDGIIEPPLLRVQQTEIVQTIEVGLIDRQNRAIQSLRFAQPSMSVKRYRCMKVLRGRDDISRPCRLVPLAQVRPR